MNLAQHIITSYTYNMGIKYQVNGSFFNVWTPVMAYVLGYWYADGSMHISSRGSYLTISSVDKEIIEKMRNWLGSKHHIKEEKNILPRRKNHFILRIGNKNLYNSMLKLGLYPNKSLTIGLPDIPQQFLCHFLRGYFDGDGCVFLETGIGVNKQKIIKRLAIILTSGSYDFLVKLSDILYKGLKLNQRKVYNSSRSYQLRYGTADSLILFKFMYGNCKTDIFLIRKFIYFRKYFALRSQRVDNDIIKIIDKFGHVAK